MPNFSALDETSMKSYPAQDSSLRILWIQAAPLHVALDAATWLETTRHLRNQGCEVVLIGEGPADVTEVDGVTIECIPKPDIYFLGTVLFQLAAVRFTLDHMDRFDVVLFHQMSAPWLLPLRILRGLRGREFPRFVMDTRDLPTTEGGLKNRLRSAYFKLVHWFANRTAHGQTVITPRMAELVKIPSHRLWGIWPSGVDVERFAGARDGRKWPGQDEPVKLCYVGKLHLERNLLPLCQAVKQANNGQLRFQLTLVGSGMHENVFRELSSNPANGIVVMNSLRHEEIPALLREHHVGVTSLPDPEDKKFQASSPIKLFEYMAAGMPILSTSNPCHTDVVRDGQYAFWADQATPAAILESLDAAYGQRQNLKRLGDESFADVAGWSWAASARKLAGALKLGLCERSCAPTPDTIYDAN